MPTTNTTKSTSDNGTRRSDGVATPTDLVQAVSASIRLFVPPAVLRPEVALRVLATVVELQRRFLVEVLTAGREAVTAADIEPMRFAVSSEGRPAA